MLVDDLASGNFNVTPIEFEAQLIRATGTDGDHRLGGAQGTKGS
jgi:molecular chaperone DnaK (HSP70)